MHVPVEAVINIIRENLNDRYRPGFPVLKELIQNADDAGATRFDFGLSPGLPMARHLLLQGPSLFVVNDGGFTDKDAAAINSIALSQKPADHATIGKFGLGLKSIFHFCEAFFYIHSQHRCLRLVNPWAVGASDGEQRDQIHPTWNDISDNDTKMVLDHLADVLPPDRFFCLWIPLRKQQHLSGNAAIIDFYPGDGQHREDELLVSRIEGQASLYQRCALLMPMLANLSVIEHWVTNGNGSDRLSTQVELQPESLRRRPFTELRPGQLLNLGGSLQLKTLGANGDINLHFTGKELLSGDSEFTALQRSPYWPKHTLTDSTTYAARTEADKAVPHAAVYFARYRGNGASSYLYVSKSVFLPVDEPERQPLAGFADDVHLLLHGYFFIDAGRSRIEGLETPLTGRENQDTHSLREQWNALIFQQATLPMVLPALAEFVQQARLSDVEIMELTGALAQLDLLKRQVFRDALCRECQWIYCVGWGFWHNPPKRYSSGDSKYQNSVPNALYSTFCLWVEVEADQSNLVHCSAISLPTPLSLSCNFYCIYYCQADVSS